MQRVGQNEKTTYERPLQENIQYLKTSKLLHCVVSRHSQAKLWYPFFWMDKLGRERISKIFFVFDNFSLAEGSKKFFLVISSVSCTLFLYFSNPECCFAVFIPFHFLLQGVYLVTWRGRWYPPRWVGGSCFLGSSRRSVGIAIRTAAHSFS